MLSRKKRRGIIEKRRRDRINTSLTELRRLVPTAFEKQGSAKLEKAEILQMTVDHLKMLHAKGRYSWPNNSLKSLPSRRITGHGYPQGCEASRLPRNLDNLLTDGGEFVSLPFCI
jgi:hypothetical protein